MDEKENKKVEHSQKVSVARLKGCRLYRINRSGCGGAQSKAHSLCDEQNDNGRDSIAQVEQSSTTSFIVISIYIFLFCIVVCNFFSTRCVSHIFFQHISFVCTFGILCGVYAIPSRFLSFSSRAASICLFQARVRVKWLRFTSTHSGQ